MLLLLFGCLFIPLSSSSSLLYGTGQISSFGEIDYGSVKAPVKILLSCWVYETIPELASQYAILEGVWEIGMLRSEYPNAKLLPWQAFGYVWNDWGKSEAIANDYILKDVDENWITLPGWGGVYHGEVLVDPANKDYQNWLGQECRSLIDRFGVDGIFADDGSSTYFYPSDILGRAINPRTGQPYTEHDYAMGFADLAKTVKSYIGTDKILIGNGGAHFGREGWAHFEDYKAVLAELDGGMAESFVIPWDGKYPSESEWVKEVEWIRWHTSQSKWSMFWAVGAETSGRDPTYILGTYLLGVTDFSKTTIKIISSWFSIIEDWLSVDYGYIMEEYHKRAGTPIYERDFTHAKVLVNPTYESYEVSLNENYTTLDGEIVSQIVLGPHTGMILLVIE